MSKKGNTLLLWFPSFRTHALCFSIISLKLVAGVFLAQSSITMKLLLVFALAAAHTTFRLNGLDSSSDEGDDGIQKTAPQQQQRPNLRASVHDTIHDQIVGKGATLRSATATGSGPSHQRTDSFDEDLAYMLSHQDPSTRLFSPETTTGSGQSHQSTDSYDSDLAYMLSHPDPSTSIFSPERSGNKSGNKSGNQSVYTGPSDVYTGPSDFGICGDRGVFDKYFHPADDAISDKSCLTMKCIRTGRNDLSCHIQMSEGEGGVQTYMYGRGVVTFITCCGCCTLEMWILCGMGLV